MLKKLSLISILIISSIYADNLTSWTTGHYYNHAYLSQELCIEGAEALEVTITGETEENYDFVTIRNPNIIPFGPDDENESIMPEAPIYYESGIQNTTFIVASNCIIAELTSDGSITKDGVTVSIVESNGTVPPPPPPPVDDNTTWTTGQYANNASLTRELCIENAEALEVTITGETEEGYDFIRVFNPNIVVILPVPGPTIEPLYENSGIHNTSFIVENNCITAELTSDASITKSGVTITIERSDINYYVQ